MANISLTRVNQKLSQARALLEGLDLEQLTPIQENSRKEAVAFHMVCAYQHYLREIGETYGLKYIADIRTESELKEAFIAAKKHPAEAEELLALRGDKDAWLARLQRYYESLWQVPVANSGAQAVEDDDHKDTMIKLVDIEAELPVGGIEFTALKDWHQQFVALVQRQRETSAEF